MDIKNTGGDIAGVTGGITAFLNILNPILDTILVIITIAWFVFRFSKAYKNDKDKKRG